MYKVGRFKYDPFENYYKIAISTAVRCMRILSRLFYLLGKPLYTFTLIFLNFIQDYALRVLNKKSGIIYYSKQHELKKQLVNIKYKIYVSYKSFLFKTSLLFNLARIFLKGYKLPYPQIPNILLPKIKSKRAFALSLIALTLAIFTVGTAMFTTIIKDLPGAEALSNRNIALTTRIYDRNGELLYSIYKDENRTLVPLSKVPMHVRLAVLAIEDAEFYEHNGFSIKGMSRAVMKYLNEKKVTGGSTITQQLVKNALLTPEKTITRKLKEIVIALRAEQKFSKDEIFEMYLNEVSFGGTAFGIQEASRVYFDKNVDELTLGEAALLAGLPRSPSRLSPFGANPELALARQHLVLDLMVENNFISARQAELAKSEPLIFAENKIDMKAPHFVMYVKQILAEKYGEEYVEQGGFDVITTLDINIQKVAQKAVVDELDKISHLNVKNGAAMVVNPKNGEVLAMVGSKDYFDTQNDGNVNVLLRPRQPGSSIKVVNYANALMAGFTPATIIEDTPVVFSIKGQKPYTPKNYDDKFRGKLTLRSALAESRNVPAVKVLNKLGVDSMINLGRDMGITTWEDKNRFGLSLTLGGGEVKMLDLAKVYATLANYGKTPELATILKIKDHNGKLIYNRECSDSDGVLSAFKNTGCEKKQTIDPRVAFTLTDILSDNQARSPAFGSHSSLVIPQHPEVAVKTGTSNNLRDNVTVGYNQDYLVLTWVGNNDNSEMSRIASGITGAAPIWNTIMQNLLADTKSVAWEAPEGMRIVKICPITGTLPCSGCPEKSEWFMDEKVPQRSCVPEKLAENKKNRI